MNEDKDSLLDRLGVAIVSLLVAVPGYIMLVISKENFRVEETRIAIMFLVWGLLFMTPFVHEIKIMYHWLHGRLRKKL